MKKNLLTVVCALAVVACSTDTSLASGESAAAAAADAVIARPIGLAATILGGALFVVSLPFTAVGGNVKQAAHALVVVPGESTFKRPLGDFSTMSDE